MATMKQAIKEAFEQSEGAFHSRDSSSASGGLVALGGSPSQRRGVRERAARQACPEATVSTLGQQPTRSRRFAQRVSATLLHHTASNKGLIVGRPVRHAVLRLIRGMDLRLHPCSVDPAENHEKYRPNRPTAESSCNNAQWVSNVADPVAYVESAWPTPTRWNGSSAPS